MKVIFEPNDFKSLPVHSDPEILGGTPVFEGTRVPVDALWNNLADGATLEGFLGFPRCHANKLKQFFVTRIGTWPLRHEGPFG